MTKMNPNIPDWKLERYLLNELDDAEMERIRGALQSDESLRARLEALEQSNREILEKYPPHRMSQRIQERLGNAGAESSKATRGWRIRIPRMVLVPAGVVAAVAFSVFVLPHLLPTGDPTVTRLKGPETQLRLYRKTDGGSQQLKDGDSAAEHDLILLQYRTDDRSYGAILSVDGRGTITTHLPAEGDQAAKLEPGRFRFLDYSYELDDAPRWEVFFFVTSASPFKIAGVTGALEASPLVTHPEEVKGIDEDFLKSLDLPDSFHITIFTLIKEARHED